MVRFVIHRWCFGEYSCFSLLVCRQKVIFPPERGYLLYSDSSCGPLHQHTPTLPIFIECASISRYMPYVPIRYARCAFVHPHSCQFFMFDVHSYLGTHPILPFFMCDVHLYSETTPYIIVYTCYMWCGSLFRNNSYFHFFMWCASTLYKFYFDKTQF